MVKKQALVVLVSLMSLVGSVFGLGLGDIEVKSNLNDPLDAEIELIQLQGLTSGEILPTLASNDDFRRAGVDRSFFLSNIQFRVREKDSGEVVIALTTRQAVREPFLNFLVEVNWPGGRLLKEYTVLLDPPVFDTGLAVDALIVEPVSANTVEIVSTTVVEDAEVTQTVTQVAPVEPRDDSLPADKYRVQRNDTLWEIALKVPARDGYSPQQVMLAIQDVNPNAFLNGNINRVKAGSVLTFPTASQIGARSIDEAISEVKAQNSGATAKLRAPVTESSEVQLSATESTSSALPASSTDKNPDGYLELTSESESSTVTASGDISAEVDQLQNQLAAVEELSDQYQRERDELESRVAELQEQIEIMERLLNVQNSDLAEVQNALSQTEQESAEAAEQAPVTEEAAVVEQAPAVQQTPVQQPVTPAVTTPAAPQSTVDKILGFVTSLTGGVSSWVMASVTNMAIAGGSLLVLILLPMWLRSRNANGNKTLSELTDTDIEDFEETSSFDADLDDDLLAEVEDDFDDDIADEPETLDAVVEAEMYMAYQKYDQAEEKLKEAFADHPDRADIGLKLLEVYAETGDVNAFNDLEARLSFTADQQAEVADLRGKLPVGGGSSALEDDVSEDLNLDLGADDLDFDMDLGDDDSAAAPAADLDFNLDLDSADDSNSADDSLDFSLDLDDSDTAEDSALDFDLNLDSDSSEEAAEPEEPADLDFSLDLGDLDSGSSDEDEISLDLGDLNDSGLDLDMGDDSEEESLSDLDFSLDMDASEPEAEADLSLDMDLDLDTGLESTEEENDFGSLDAGLDFSLEDEAADDLSLDVESDLASLDAELSDLDASSDFESLDSGLDDLDFTGSDASDELSVESDLSSEDPLQQLADSLDSEAELEEDEFDFLSGSDEASTKLDLARAYIEMDDRDGARDILEEVAAEGTDEQKAQARELIEQL